jgi:putative acetyltransferase
MRVALESPDQPDVVRLIDELDAYQKPLYPPESHHGIDLAALKAPNVLFAVIRDTDGHAVGCGAIVLGPLYGEIKRMYVIAEERGAGLGRRLLGFLETQARAHGCHRFMLETGVLQHAAIALYQRHGYRFCRPFGAYRADPHSVFMHKDIA